MRNIYKVMIIALSIFCFACKNNHRHITGDSSIDSKNSYSGLSLDSVQLQKFLKAHPEYNSYEEQYANFYEERNYQYAWFDETGLADQADNFMTLMHSTIGELHDSSLYNKTFDSIYHTFNEGKKKTKEELLETELLFTGQFFFYAAKIYKGSDVDAAKLGWYIPRKKVDLTALLDSMIKSKGVEPDHYAPLNSQYKKLQEYLVKYSQIDKSGSADTVPKIVKPLKSGDSSLVIITIKKRLQMMGDMKPGNISSKFDTELSDAVKSFQTRMGLAFDGTINSKTAEELNVSVNQRIRQILINMERARWMPPESDTNYILVNIPEYKMHVYDNGKQVFDMNVIVGKATTGTVIFKGYLKFIVFSPYWNVPTSIVQNEVVPAMNKNPNYLAKNNMEITGNSNGLPVVRQKPGPGNSLGLVKFLFPNNYNIYFHDTPNHELFGESSRSFSHGCIRIGEPKKFAEYLLRNDPTWTSASIDSAMHLDKEKWVTLNRTIPVFIVYFTAWVDMNGQLNFRKDIYGHDEKMSSKLFLK